MEPSTGDAYKMLLGSLEPNWDEKVNAVNKLRDPSPTATIYATSLSGSVKHSLELGSQTPRASVVSIPTISAESLRSHQTSYSLARQHTETSPISEAGGSSRQGRSLAPQSDERGASVSRSPSSRSQKRRSWIPGRLS